MNTSFKDMISAVWPAVRAAAIRAAKVGAYMIAAAAVAAVEAYVTGRTSLDPAFLLLVNLALAAARKGLEDLRREADAAA